MIVTTALSKYLGTGNFLTSGYVTVTPDTTNNYVQIDGCTAYSDSISSLIYLKYMVNKAYVAATNSFSVYLYDMDGTTEYNIAYVTSGVTFSSS